ncbi:MAG TPA: glutamate--cysteine ligase [Intrasporangium sp.]|uniref:carboxylate-amine ligase n=1 Tax=Intrasporangium sp. TaxID=1925024 RepID=UPI002D7A04A5|nr:glutamate--cysteine ligase [Intrasporangium sp.]HET7399850.1 glutamate--cysteine ligase [Intrasporangium sp.]
MRSVGVEEELLLVNADDGQPQPVAGQVLARAGAEPGAAVARGAGALTAEFMQEQLELQTPPVQEMDELHRELRKWRDCANRAAQDLDCAVAALGTSPVRALPTAVDSPRYRAMHREFGLLAREQLTCGCHVHVGVSSDEEGVAVLDRIRVWLPVLLALSANSPFWAGQDSGYSSHRWLVMSRWPAAGPLACLGSAAAYHRLVDSLVESGVLLDHGMLYFDARLSHRFPTVEVRVADVCLDVEDTVVLAALSRALVDTAATQWRRRVDAPAMPNELLRMATWRAAHEGVGGTLLHPHTGRPTPAEDVVDLLVRHVHAALEASGDLSRVLQGLARIRARGTGSVVQRRLLARGGDPAAVVAAAVRLTAGTADEDVARRG